MTPDEIIRDLARLDLRTFPDWSGRTDLRSLVLAARAAERPTERPARQAGADDYAAVVQFAVVLTHDGRVLTTRRHDAPGHALAPILGALRHETAKLVRLCAREAKVPEREFEELVGRMADEAGEAEFRSRALRVGSRSVQHPTVTESPG